MNQILALNNPYAVKQINQTNTSTVFNHLFLDVNWWIIMVL